MQEILTKLDELESVIQDDETAFRLIREIRQVVRQGLETFESPGQVQVHGIPFTGDRPDFLDIQPTTCQHQETQTGKVELPMGNPQG